MAGQPRERTEEERARAKEAVCELIRWIGDDPGREGLKDTPRRVVDAFLEYFRGYEECPETYLQRTFEQVGGYDEIVLLVGCGNFVATLCKANWIGEPYAQADLFRIENDLIVEHWDAAEKILPKDQWVNSGKF